MIRHFLLEPLSLHYPKAPGWLRHTMFLFATVVIFLGLRFVWAFMSDAPDVMPPQPGASMELMSMILVIYKGSMLANVLRQRYPEEVWTKLNRINDHLLCKEGTVLSGLRARFRR
jgi:hypothetical protein